MLSRSNSWWSLFLLDSCVFPRTEVIVELFDEQNTLTRRRHCPVRGLSSQFGPVAVCYVVGPCRFRVWRVFHFVALPSVIAGPIQPSNMLKSSRKTTFLRFPQFICSNAVIFPILMERIMAFHCWGLAAAPDIVLGTQSYCMLARE